MNALASELNDQLEGTVVLKLFSDLGRRMYFPKGIVAQAAEANARAHRFNATVGMAYEGGSPMTLPVVRDLTGGLDTAESVAYAPTAGVPALRDLWREEISRKNPSLGEVPTTRPAVVPGLTAGIGAVADLFAEPGNVLLLPDLFWGNYRLIFEERRECRLHEFSFFDDAGAFNRSAFAAAARAAAASGKLMVMLNFPNNPAGFAPTVEDAEFIRATLVSLAESVPVMAICDDAYFGLFYSDTVFRESMFALLADAHRNLLAVKVDGATKEEFVWGFRVGFVTLAFQGITPDHAGAIEKKLMGAIRSSVSNSSMLSQSLVLRTMQHPDYPEQKRQKSDILAARFSTLQTILAERDAAGRAPALEALPCNSGYFMSFRCRGIGAEALRQRLLDRGVGTIAIKDTYLRVAFAGIDEADLVDLYEEIFSAAEQLAATATR